jgi:NADPH-dependent 2,4-dienoyl-CoA reductase/sulfur reductase-like enzyme/nitrite reductase/ring-hydroxylating ferredoxin subunit
LPTFFVGARMAEAIVARADDLRDGEMMQVKVGKRTALPVRVGGRFYALGAKCPHYGAPMEEGLLHGHRLLCPYHKSVFDALTGDLEETPTLEALAQFEARVEDGNVIVTVPDRAPSERTMPMAKHDPAADSRHFVILGGGAAGSAAAAALRQEGFEGRITMVTKEADLPYDRPQLSKDFLGSTEEVSDPSLRSGEFYDEYGIEVRTRAEVASVDVPARRLEFADGGSLGCDALLLATGGRPRRLPVEGGELENVFTLRSLADCRGIKEVAQEGKRAVVVGASFIGMETAASLTRRGLSVTVVGKEEVPFERALGPEIGRMFQAMHEEAGTTFRLGAGLKGFAGKGKVEAVLLEDGERIGADLVLTGVGIAPATEMLKGVDLNEDGSVTVDARLRIADEVYAAGDIARFPDWRTDEAIRIEHWRLAQQHGRVAARNMVGRDEPFRSAPFFWTNQGGPSLGYVGYTRGWDEIIYQGDPAEGDFLAFYVRAGRIMAVAGLRRNVALCAALCLMEMDGMPTPDEVRGGAELGELL